jgi:protein-S-isoprenylcysteine O-methyltransferase Ste14
MYVAVIAIILGQALLIGDSRLILLAALFWLTCHLFVTFYEEPTLAEKFGAHYGAYRAAVPRWIPRLAAWRD